MTDTPKTDTPIVITEGIDRGHGYADISISWTLSASIHESGDIVISECPEDRVTVHHKHLEFILAEGKRRGWT